jgi:hypothetical protein
MPTLTFVMSRKTRAHVLRLVVNPGCYPPRKNEPSGGDPPLERLG